MLHQIKASQFYTEFRSPKTLLKPPVNGKNQGLFNAFESFSSTFQGKFNFQGLQDRPVYLSTFQACANPRGLGSLIFSAYVGSGPASTVHPQKISGISSIPKKIFEILATQKNTPSMFLDFKKRP